MSEQAATIDQDAFNQMDEASLQRANILHQAHGTQHSGNSQLCHTLWAAGGFLFFALAMVGIALPFLPTTPFVLVAAFCFARSSERLNQWFKGTKLYKNVLEGYVTKKSMTLKAKLTILAPVTLLLSIGFVLMSNVPVGRVALAVVWVAHIIYFGFVVKTDHGEATA